MNLLRNYAKLTIGHDRIIYIFHHTWCVARCLHITVGIYSKTPSVTNGHNMIITGNSIPKHPIKGGANHLGGNARRYAVRRQITLVRIYRLISWLFIESSLSYEVALSQSYHACYSNEPPWHSCRVYWHKPEAYCNIKSAEVYVKKKAYYIEYSFHDSLHPGNSFCIMQNWQKEVQGNISSALGIIRILTPKCQRMEFVWYLATHFTYAKPEPRICCMEVIVSVSVGHRLLFLWKIQNDHVIFSWIVHISYIDDARCR